MIKEIKTKTQHYFVDDQNRIQGEYKSYRNNGQLWVHSFYLNDKRHGEYIHYFKNGQLYIHSFYQNDKPHGEYKSYHDNGQLDTHTSYLNGKLHGEFKSYYENGQLWVHAFFQNGKRHGEYKSYYRSGKLHINASFKNGKLYGVYKEYDTKENLRVHLFFHKGIKLAVCPNALSKCDLTYLMLTDKLPPKFSSTHFAFNNDNSSWYLQIVIPKSHNVFTIMVSRIHSIIPNLYFHIATPSYKPPFGSLNPLFLDQR